MTPEEVIVKTIKTAGGSLPDEEAAKKILADLKAEGFLIVQNRKKTMTTGSEYKDRFFQLNLCGAAR